MSWEVRPFRGRPGVWEYDLRIRLPDGTLYRERRKSAAKSERDAGRDAERRHDHLVRHGPKRREEPHAPRLEDYAPGWLASYSVERRLADSTRAAYASAIEARLRPHIGGLRLDQIDNAEVSRLVGALANYSPSAVNVALAVLRKLLKTAVRRGEIDVLPCEIERVPDAEKDPVYYEGPAYEAVLYAAEDDETEALILLGGEAGLRVGEIQALRWEDFNEEAKTLRVRRTLWRGKEGPTKGKRNRTVPTTPRLVAALKALRHLRGPYVLCHDDGTPYGYGVVSRKLAAAQRQAWERKDLGRTHKLRHTFCSRLASAAAPAVAIQALAGHANLTTTQRYMHLSPAERNGAVALLTRGEERETKGGGGEAPTGQAVGGGEE